MEQLVAWYSRDNDTWSSHTRYNTQIICISFEKEYDVCRKLRLRFLIFESRRNVYFRKEIRSSLISALNFIKILITYFTRIESNRISFFSNPFKSFRIRDDILITDFETSTHLNSYPIVFERRTLLIGWNFVPRFENSRRPIAFPLGFYSLIFRARDIVHTDALRMEFEEWNENCSGNDRWK